MSGKAQTELREGYLIGGKYRLEREIGRGAMGTVWSAVHETLDQRVAIKVISQEHADSEELRKRFDTEARAAAKLRSRFVVGVSDNGETESGLPYIVMEYLEGECLEDRIARLGSIPFAEALRISRHIARALSRAHSRGIVHRDLKPANIFISESDDDDDAEDWTAKVLDFGIAKMEDFADRSTTKTGAVLGTPLFMSPEQVRGASTVDARADLYSFGMVVYNMLTGTFAFEGQSFGDLLVSICTDPLPKLSRLAPQASSQLDSWFEKACARDPGDRFQTADETVKALSVAIGLGHVTETRFSIPDMGTVSMHLDSPPPPGLKLKIDTENTGTPRTQGAMTPMSQQGTRLGLDSASATAAAVTMHAAPKEKSKKPLYLALGATLLIGALSFSSLGGDNSSGVDEAARASQAQDAPSEPPQIEDAELTAPSDKSDADEAPPTAAAATAPSLDQATKLPTDKAKAKGSQPQSKGTAPSSSATRSSSSSKTRPAPSPATAPQSTPTQAPSPEPAPAAAPKPVDVGF